MNSLNENVRIAALQQQIESVRHDLITREGSVEFRRAKKLYNKGIVVAQIRIGFPGYGEEWEERVFCRKPDGKFAYYQRSLESKKSLRGERKEDLWEIRRHLRNLCVENGLRHVSKDVFCKAEDDVIVPPETLL